MPRKTNAEIAAALKSETAAMIAANNEQLMAQFAALLGNTAPAPVADAPVADKAPRGRPRGSGKGTAPDKPTAAPVPTNTPITAQEIAHYATLTAPSERNGKKFNARYATAPRIVGKHLIGADGADKHLVRVSTLKAMWGENKGSYIAQADVTLAKTQVAALIAALQAAHDAL